MNEVLGSERPEPKEGTAFSRDRQSTDKRASRTEKGAYSGVRKKDTQTKKGGGEGKPSLYLWDILNPFSSSHSDFCPNLLRQLPRAELPCAESLIIYGKVDWQSQKCLALSIDGIS